MTTKRVFVKQFTFKHHWLHIALVRKPNLEVTAVTSRTKESNQHSLFLDYDNVDYEVIERDLKYIYEKYLIDLFFIFKEVDRDSYHVISPCLFSYKKISEILKESHCDNTYSNFKDEQRCFALRVSEKYGKVKELIKVTRFKRRGRHLISKGMVKFLEFTYGTRSNISQYLGKYYSDDSKMEDIIIKKYNIYEDLQKEV